MSVASSDFGDDSSIAGRVELGHRALGQVATVRDLPFVVGVVQHGSDEADDGGLVGEDADDAGAAFDLTVEPLGLVDQILTQWLRGKPVKARTSVFAWSISGPILGKVAASWSRTWSQA
jgi:hypothetical protein